MSHEGNTQKEEQDYENQLEELELNKIPLLKEDDDYGK